MDHLPGCYLTTFNMSDRDNYRSNGQQQLSVEVTHTSKQRYSVTDTIVNRAVLGPQAATMCAERDLYMLRQQTNSTNDGRLVKRKSSWSVSATFCCCGYCLRVTVSSN
ncbi:uncharacterized protein LOC128240047 [Mya arenaria]|uniref:uncharacterized protein LOC128240047 n=1 Tax=Mya arenaria TaxID=6604 RepID=UPI0022DFF8DA|nr:uncharacterized protein LOC128240047 [Mya arenaria]